MNSVHSKIAVLHHLGAGNLGDEAALQAVIQNILKRQPDAEVTALTMNPGDTTARHGIPALPIRSHTWGKGYETRADDSKQAGKSSFGAWLGSTRNPLVRIPRALLREAMFFASVFMTVRRYDLFVVSGGGQLTGRSGPWGFPFGIFIWIYMARLAGVKRVILNIGAGPLNSRLVKWFSVASLKAANYVSFRDARSQGLVRKEGFNGAGSVVADSAYLIDIPQAAPSSVKREKPVVGISPMPYPFCDPQEIPSGHQEIYEDFIGKFAAFAASLVKSSFSIELFCNDVGVDPRAIEDIRKVLRDDYQIELPPYQPDHDLAQLLARTAALDYVVTCRFHGVVLAHLFNKPILGVAHHPKVSTAMASIGLADYCFDIATFDANQLADAFASLVSHSDEIKRELVISLAVYRAQLTNQFDELFPPAPARVQVPVPRQNPGDAGQVDSLPHKVA
jgi:polysaccharide pyruvyl transferase WcaK-like protein